MKSHIIIICVLLLMASCQQTPSPGAKVTLTGTVSSDLRNEAIFLRYMLKDSLIINRINIDENGKFSVAIDSIDTPAEAILTLDTTNYAPKVNLQGQFSSMFLFQFGSDAVPVQYGNAIDSKMFLLNDGETKLDIRDSLYQCTLSNSPINDELGVLAKSLHPVISRYNAYKNNGIDISTITDFTIIDSLTRAYNDIWMERQGIYDDYIVENPQSMISLFALKYKYGGVNPDVVRLFDNLSDSVKATNLGKRMAVGVRNYKSRMSRGFAKGDIIPNFTLPDADGNLVSLYDIKARYIFLDFWTSWCGSCRKENKLIQTYYDRFNQTDFQMIGVSADDSELKWKKAMEKDRVKWTSLWDSDKKVDEEFGVISYPTNFLMNSDHQIIATALSAEKLKAKLEELLD